MTPHEPSVALCICGDPTCSVPYGTCHCLCGKSVKISPITDRSHGWKKGEPRLFLVGHCGKIRPLIEQSKTFKIEGVYCRLIPLTRRLHTIVWESDYEWLMQWKWYAWWEKGKGFYAVRGMPFGKGKRHTYSMHRQILGLRPMERDTGDHENGNSLDNRRSNLRSANHAEQMRNRGILKNNTSGYKGVSWHTGGQAWAARIMVNKRSVFLGYFNDPKFAYEAYCAAAKHHHKAFARLQ